VKASLPTKKSNRLIKLLLTRNKGIADVLVPLQPGRSSAWSLRRFQWFTACAMLAALFSCAKPTFLTQEELDSLEGAIERAEALFAYDPVLNPSPQETLEFEHEDYILCHVHFPDRPESLFPGQGVHAFEYRPRKTGPNSAAGILIVPIQGADYEVSTYFAEYFVSKGFSCLRFERRAEWLLPDRALPSLGLLFREYVIDIQRGLDWWQDSGHVDPGRIGLFGVSMGAVIGSIVTALECPHLRTSVLVIGGGSVADILLTADRQWLSRFDGCEEALSRELHGALDPVDPMRVAPKICAPSTLMIHARFDPLVRYPLSTSLWEAAGRPKRIVLPTGHYSTVLFIHYIRWKAYRWLAHGLAE
jgi:hypothetical protein